MKLTIDQIIATSHSKLHVPPRDAGRVLTSLQWDSRQVLPNSLFVAIVGEKANGNDYICEALAAGAAVVIASEDPASEALAAAEHAGAALLQAENNDILGALQAIAHAWRKSLGGTVVAVTGSSGKTTTKDLIAGVLAPAFATHATSGNRNSEIGVAETLLNATPEHEVIVCEMGMSSLGEIDFLCQAALPHIGVVTNVGVAHCELLGSRENIARAKAELLENLPDHTGIAILPGDDPYTPDLRVFGQLDERMIGIVLYGLGAQNDIRATHIVYDDMGHPSFDIWTPDGRCYPAKLCLQGEHNILNALAAVAVGLKLGVSITNIIAALEGVKPAALRQEIVKTPSGDLILNDTYNANPDSMRAALSLFKRLAAGDRHIAVLGDMYELGTEEVCFHRQIGEYAFVNGVDELVTVGKLGSEIAAGALAVGMPPARVHTCADVNEALSCLETMLARGGEQEAEPSVVLVKASRGMQLERIVEGLLARADDQAHEAAPAGAADPEGQTQANVTSEGVE